MVATGAAALLALPLVPLRSAHGPRGLRVGRLGRVRQDHGERALAIRYAVPDRRVLRASGVAPTPTKSRAIGSARVLPGSVRHIL
jgi:hypothetical protein